MILFCPFNKLWESAGTFFRVQTMAGTGQSLLFKNAWSKETDNPRFLFQIEIVPTKSMLKSLVDSNMNDLKKQIT